MIRTLATLLTCLLVLQTFGDHAAELHAGSKRAKRPIVNPKFDPEGTEVELFSAIDAGQIGASLIPQSSFGGKVFIENKTDKVLNVKVPDALLAIPVHAQIGGGFGGGGLGGGGLAGGGFGGQGGGQQTLGGGFGGGGGLGGGGLGGGGFGGGAQLGGGGFFSVPPERVVALTFNSVCLQHGRPEPTASSRYRLVPLSKVSEDPVLHDLLAVVTTGSVNSMATQAAAWAISDGMSWQQLANESITHLGGQPSTPFFTHDQLRTAQHLLAQVVEQSKGRKEAPSVRANTPSAPPAVGSIMDFELASLAGEKVKLSQLCSKGTVVVVVLRGFPGYQCPLCTKQFGDYVERAEALKSAGASVAFIYPGPSQKLKDRAAEFVKGKDYPDHFQILLDPDYSFTVANGLRWDEKGETAYPSTFVVDDSRKVTFAVVSKTHGGRAKAADVVKAITSR